MLILECIIACIVLTLIILPALFKNPVAQIMSYPIEIRRRVESLPQYSSIIKKKEKKHISVKILAVFIFAIALAVIIYIAGEQSFIKVFKHGFIIFFVVNLYDMVVLDLIIFCHSMWVRIPGTEDMDKEYKNPRHHIVGAVKGIGIGIIVALISASIVEVLNLI